MKSMDGHSEIPDGLPGLLASLVDGQLSPQQRQELSDLLMDSPVTQRFYLRYLATHAMLRQELSSRLPTLATDDLDGKIGLQAQLVQQQKCIAKLLEDATNLLAAGEFDVDDFCKNLRLQASPMWRELSLQTMSGNDSAETGNHSEKKASQPSNSRRSLATFSWVALAASLMLVATYAWLRPSESVEVAEREQGTSVFDEPGPLPPVIGKLVSASKGCRLFIDGAQVDSPINLPLHSKQEICLVGGTAEIRFANGVRSVLKAPAILIPESSMLVHLAEGSLASDVGKSGHGFTVTTSQARVVDLGTSFGIAAKLDGVTQVVVFEGEVDVLSQEEFLADPETSPLRLKMGEGVDVLNDGRVRPTVSFISSDYHRPGPADAEDWLAGKSPSLDSVISSVSDSIDRLPDNYFRYEIVASGMREDAVAYADRIHEWNGVDESGMPEYLVGGDYVKMINNTRYIDDYRVFITIDRPAYVYVLIDDRKAPPQWLVDQFEDTGDNIGMDEGPGIRSSGKLLEREMPAIGPGAGIHHVHSIWRKELDSADTVECGSVLAKPGDDIQVMYGIVVVPIE